MKKFLVAIFMMLSAVGMAVAQPPKGDKGEKIKALYVAYITQELGLTPQEAQSFWPVHTQYEAEIQSLKPEASELDRQQAVLNIKKKYQDKFSKVLGNDRTNQFFIKDGEFRKRMIDRLRQMRQQNPGQGLRRMQ